MTAEVLGDILARVNASLNLMSTVFLIAGLYAIRRKRTHRHRLLMLMALACSALFLVSYVVRFSIAGTHTFAGTGIWRSLYLGILFTHMPLAVLVLPMVLRLVYLAQTKQFRRHARLARKIYPIWLYVSVTGLIVYLMLYQIFGYV